MPSPTVFALAALLAACLPPAAADFLYPDFNATRGLAFNGAADVVSCLVEDERTGVSVPLVVSEGVMDWAATTVETNDEQTSDLLAQQWAAAAHRDLFASAPLDGCAVRLRLTPSQPFQAGSVFYTTPVSLLNGFETAFRFQVTDQARTCTNVRDRHFTVQHYRSCMVHGGDGIALILHGAPAGSSALGAGGSQLGFGGVSNSLVVKLDTWYNPELGDLQMDYVSIHSAGARENSADAHTRLGSSRAHALADGHVHTVKVVYEEGVDTALLGSLTASTPLLKFLVDGGEGNRLGTLSVYIDDMDTALLAIPINLSAALALGSGDAWVGFTSATGTVFEKHDILAWYLCEEAGCPKSKLDTDFQAEEAVFDYSQRSNA